MKLSRNKTIGNLSYLYAECTIDKISGTEYIFAGFYLEIKLSPDSIPASTYTYILNASHVNSKWPENLA